MKLGPFALMPGCLSVIEQREIDEWEPPVNSLIEMQKNIPWWLGDLVVHGEAQWGDDFWQSMPEDCNLEMLERFANIARKIPVDDRVPSLSWSHHVIALRLSNRLMRKAALRHAEKQGMDTKQFSSYVNGL